MVQKDILERFVTEIWLGNPSLKEKLNQSKQGEMSFQSDQIVIIITKNYPKNCESLLITITGNNQKKEFLCFAADEMSEPRIFACYFTNDEANAHLDYVISHLAEIIEGLKYGQKIIFANTPAQ